MLGTYLVTVYVLMQSVLIPTGDRLSSTKRSRNSSNHATPLGNTGKVSKSDRRCAWGAEVQITSDCDTARLVSRAVGPLQQPVPRVWCCARQRGGEHPGSDQDAQPETGAAERARAVGQPVGEPGSGPTGRAERYAACCSGEFWVLVRMP